MQTVNSREDFEKALKNDGIQVFLFTTKWCGDCMFIKPFMPEVEKAFDQRFHTNIIQKTKFVVMVCTEQVICI